MAVLAFASFNGVPGTDLVDYTPESGGSFFEHPQENAGQAVISDEGRARGNASQTVSILYDPQVPTPDCEASCTVHVKSLTGACGLVARSSDQSRTAVTVGYNAAGGVWVIAELINGVLGASQFIPETLSTNEDYALRMVCQGNVIEAYVNDELIGSIETQVLGAGYAGLSFLGGSNTTGLHIDDWRVEIDTEDGTVTDSGSALISTRGDVVESASARISLASETAKPASASVAVAGAAQAGASARIAVTGAVLETASVRVALPAERSAPGSVRISAPAEVIETGSVRVKLAAEVTEAASANLL